MNRIFRLQFSDWAAMSPRYTTPQNSKYIPFPISWLCAVHRPLLRVNWYCSPYGLPSTDFGLSIISLFIVLISPLKPKLNMSYVVILVREETYTLISSLIEIWLYGWVFNVRQSTILGRSCDLIPWLPLPYQLPVLRISVLCVVSSLTCRVIYRCLADLASHTLWCSLPDRWRNAVSPCL